MVIVEAPRVQPLIGCDVSGTYYARLASHYLHIKHAYIDAWASVDTTHAINYHNCNIKYHSCAVHPKSPP